MAEVSQKLRPKVAGMMELEAVDVGTDEFLKEYSTKRSKTKAIPEGVSTRGIYHDIVHIAWPTLIELTLSQLTSMFDLMMVGNLGETAIAAVSLATQPKFILNTIFTSMNVGATALVARCRGADEPERANHFMRQALILNLLFAVLSMAVGLLFTGPLIGLDETAERGDIYGRRGLFADPNVRDYSACHDVYHHGCPARRWQYQDGDDV